MPSVRCGQFYVQCGLTSQRLPVPHKPRTKQTANMGAGERRAHVEQAIKKVQPAMSTQGGAPREGAYRSYITLHGGLSRVAGTDRGRRPD